MGHKCRLERLDEPTLVEVVVQAVPECALTEGAAPRVVIAAAGMARLGRETEAHLVLDRLISKWPKVGDIARRRAEQIDELPHEPQKLRTLLDSWIGMGGEIGD